MYVIEVSRLDEIPDTGDTGELTAPVLCYGPAEHLSEAWAGGCSDYLKDPWMVSELHFRIHRILSGTGNKIEAGGITVSGTELRCGEKQMGISAQERKIFSLLCRHPGVVVPREALYYSIWGRVDANSRVVDVHISRLRRKLSLLQTHLPEAERIEVTTSRGEGYAIR